MTRSWTSGSTLVAPHAIRALCPSTTPGTPGKETPATSYGQAVSTTRQCRPFMYQIDGIEIPRCGSLASSAPPVTDIEGATTQLFDPTPWSDARPSASSRPAIRSAACPSPATDCQAARCSAVNGSGCAVPDAVADGSAGLGRRSARFDP